MFAKWTSPSLYLEQTIVNFRDFSIKILRQADNSIKGGGSGGYYLTAHIRKAP